jgi:hypothetical protein
MLAMEPSQSQGVKPFGGLQSLLTENMRCFLMARFRKESYHDQADGLCELAYIRWETGCDTDAPCRATSRWNGLRAITRSKGTALMLPRKMR